MSDTPQLQRGIRSFVIRGGRMTAAQQKAWDRYWPEWGLEPESGEIKPADVFGREAPLVLEIGFGMGQSLVEMAAAAPEKNFIGVEVHRPGVGSALRLAHEQGLTNLRVYCCDANDVIDRCLPEASVDTIQLFFPDPWHKKRHHKRRLVQPEFVARLRRILKPGGIFHMATDWEPYAEHMLEVMTAAEGYENLSPTGDYVPRPAHRPETKFERRGARLGHGVWDLMFRHTPDSGTQDD
ncbi:MAG: tRNA (guanosine(46)-N7)-methyltransferase TrmB [Gammaproteobacteria bacterium]|nr:MAG: tRNA (guanosine(46)-N7)-methyltransferase TrmB [Gammaproteobacteria bacterium]